MIPRLTSSVQTSNNTTTPRIRVASLNVWALAEPLSQDVAERMFLIGEALANLNADLVALQEVWTADAGRSLEASGRAAGLPHAWNGGERVGGSGLMVLSRWPTEPARFAPFLTRGLPQRIWHGDYWGGKGLCHLRVQSPAGPIEFVDTHLHAQYDEDGFPEYYTHRMGQVVQLSSALDGIAVPVIAAGDFNMLPDSDEYRVLAGTSGLRDAAREARNEQATSLGSNVYNGDQKRDARIDYLYVRDGAAQGIRVAQIERSFDAETTLNGSPANLSDHAGLVADLEITQTPMTRPALDPAAAELARRGLERGIELAGERRNAARGSGAIGLAIGAAAIGLRRYCAPQLSRRRLLRGMLATAAGVAGGTGLIWGAGSDFATRREIRDYQHVMRHLDALTRNDPPAP
jgi:endonuclease/exonuclease/phosphatase family metal-dependent hydrolase